MKNTFGTTTFRLLICVLLCLTIISPAVADDAFQQFFRFDLDSADAWREPLSNERFLTAGAWSLAPLSAEKCAWLEE